MKGSAMKILVTSSKGGIGKSTLSVGLANAFAAMGIHVLLVDLDLYGRSLDLLLGVDDEALFDIGDLCAGRCTPDKVLLHPWDGKNVDFCPSPAVYDAADFAPGAIAKALDALAECTGADHVICDTAGMVCAPEVATGFADTVLLVTTQIPTSVRAVPSTVTALGLGENDADRLRLVINTFDVRDAADGTREGVLSIIDESGVRCAGIVPYDRSLMLAAEDGELPDAKSPAMTALRNIALRLEGNDVKLFTGIKSIKKKTKKRIL